MDFHYRYVGFGTTFVRDEKPRTACDAAADAQRGPKPLCTNELAVDVGGRTFGYEGEMQPIFDHHFHRPNGQFPSASATVLHHAAKIHQRFAGIDSLWLVAHLQPDFDALCAMYLARQIVAGVIPHEGWEQFGLHPDGWLTVETGEKKSKIDWFAPEIETLPPERRWPILLAAYASRVDMGRHLNCARDRALHAVLYAAMHRGRSLTGSGAWDFFEAARHAISDRGLNPLFDSLFDNEPEYRPELDLLDRENRAYLRDITRARRSIVYLHEKPFEDWYTTAAERPLFQSDGTVNPFHLDCGKGNFRQADGIYIRDPECLLFKEWARSDIENSFSRQGFLFTAIAYSNQRQGKLNTSNYFFSLDPERSGHAHLYNLWTSLQAEECFSIRATPPQPNGKKAEPRAIVRQRALGFESEFADPWFDGGNYHCTIIATPNDGTLIGAPGIQSDLSDDSIALIVRDALELAVFEGDVTVQDIPASAEEELSKARPLPAAIARSHLKPADAAHYRFVSVAAAPDVNFENPAVAEQMGHYLWQLLVSDKTLSVPSDFVQRHLVVEHSSVGVWNRKGVAIAYRGQRGSTQAADTREILRALVTLAGKSEKSLKMDHERLKALEANLREAVSLKQKLALPENRILSRFYQASQLDEVLSASHNMDSAASDRKRSREMSRALREIKNTQKKVEWVEVFLIAVYATELARAVLESFEAGSTWTGWAILALAFLAMPAAVIALNQWPEMREAFNRREHRKRFWGVLVWIALFIFLLFAAMYSRNHESPPRAAPESPPATQTTK